MSSTRSTRELLRQAAAALGQSTRVFARDVGHGLLEVSHNTLALLGLLMVALLVFVASRDDIRHQTEVSVFGWLQARHEARQDPVDAFTQSLREPDAIARATATDPKELTRQQAAVAHWLSKRYKVAPEPISRLVQEAWVLGDKVGLEPTLLLAIMAIESGFNPFAQSPVGAQGLMQVMTRIHDDKYEAFGGNHAAFDPVTNLRVGVLVLKECIARAGSLEQGLRFYVGAANLPDDGGYAGKVLGEQAHMRNVLMGRAVSVTAPIIVPSVPLPTLPAMEQAKDEPAQDKPSTQTTEQVAMLKPSAG
jgi:Transglycosylase SLT domain